METSSPRSHRPAVWPGTWVALAALAAAGCDALFGPSSYEEAMKSAGLAIQSGQMRKAHQLCQRAFAFSDEAGNGSRAVIALDCIAEATARLGMPEKALPYYALVLERYDTGLKTYAGRFRLRNDLGVVLYLLGRRDEGVRALEDALDAYSGTPYASTHHAALAQRMHIVVNLAHASRSRPDSALARRLLGPIADEIVTLAEAGAADGVEARVTEALGALGDLASGRGGAARVAEAADHSGANPECHKIELFGTPIERCFARLP